ncbi:MULTISPECIES: hypothetical protein [Brevibacillus]|uniref:hypothetical protein n=1 Tax=Brevibacillus TaxID=55080 RepID=UPI000EE6D6AA|nr:MULTISPECIES: hypothetical protein [Brevibacillus]MDR4997868.1 hypothetical protein [Brevibacillus parabrevis]HBZ80940.1 hypothetical protein [Brevibacillus sp.]
MNIAEKFVEVILRANQGDVEAKLIVGLTKVVVDGIITEDQLQKLVDVYQTQGRQESHALLEQFLSQNESQKQQERRGA